MDELEQLMLQEGLLVQELELVRAKIEFINLIKFGKTKEIAPSNQQKVIDTPCSSGSKISNTVIDVPDSKLKTSTSPVQTVSGKDISTPLKAVDLPKIQKEVQTSNIKLVTPEQFCFKPNQGIPIPIKPKVVSLVPEKSGMEIQIPKSNATYYVVYNGPNPGIYSDWSFTKKATEGVSNVIMKKYKSFQEARISADAYSRVEGIPPFSLVTHEEFLRPNTFSAALQKKKDTKTLLGKLKLPVRREFKEATSSDESSFDLSEAGFEYCYRHARLADESKYVEEKFYTTDLKNLSYYNFTKAANPEQVYEAFQYGLIKTIYPSSNLLEISHFPKVFLTAVKNFRKKCTKHDQEIFLKINSSGPYWNKAGQLVYHPQHLVQIGICKQELYHASTTMECRIDPEDLLDLAIRRLEGLIQKVFNFSSEDGLFVNYQDSTILMYSKSPKKICEADEAKFVRFQSTLLNSTLLGEHLPMLCKKIKSHCIDYECNECIKESGSPTNNSSPKAADTSTTADSPEGPSTTSA